MTGAPLGTCPYDRFDHTVMPVTVVGPAVNPIGVRLLGDLLARVVRK